MELKKFCKTDLLLTKIVWEVGDHDLVLGWNTIGWWATLAALTWWTWGLLLILVILVGSLVGDVLEWQNLAVLHVTLLLFDVRICAAMTGKQSRQLRI